jgi:hypothetical protein
MQDISTEKLRVPEGPWQSTPEVREYIVYTPHAGHQKHGEAQGPRGFPGRQSTPEAREYKLYTPDAEAGVLARNLCQLS